MPYLPLSSISMGPEAVDPMTGRPNEDRAGDFGPRQRQPEGRLAECPSAVAIPREVQCASSMTMCNDHVQRQCTTTMYNDNVQPEARPRIYTVILFRG